MMGGSAVGGAVFWRKVSPVGKSTNRSGTPVSLMVGRSLPAPPLSSSGARCLPAGRAGRKNHGLEQKRLSCTDIVT